MCYSVVEDHVDGGVRGGREQTEVVRGKGHSRTVSDVSYISTGSGSQGVGKTNTIPPVFSSENYSSFLSLAINLLFFSVTSSNSIIDLSITCQ